MFEEGLIKNLKEDIFKLDKLYSEGSLSEKEVLLRLIRIEDRINDHKNNLLLNED